MSSRMSILTAQPSVRNVSESSILPMTTKDTLLQVLAILDAMLTHSDRQDFYTDVAERLSKIADKKPTWGWRYIQSVASGTVKPSKKFSHAVEILAISLDGVPAPLADSVPVTVYAKTGTIPDGAFVIAKAQRCANPSCTVMFVPNTPLRKYCSLCRPQKVTR
jgi:hypothetical protein